MSFFKHVQLHKYDLTNKGISQACYDEMRGEGLDLMLNEDEMRHLAAVSYTHLTLPTKA